MERKSPITRRGFVQLSSGLLVTSISNATARTEPGVSRPTNSDLVGLTGKIVLEEHFDFSGTEKSSYASFGGPEFQRQIKDLGRGACRNLSRRRGTLHRIARWPWNPGDSEFQSSCRGRAARE